MMWLPTVSFKLTKKADEWSVTISIGFLAS